MVFLGDVSIHTVAMFVIAEFSAIRIVLSKTMTCNHSINLDTLCVVWDLEFVDTLVLRLVVVLASE